MRIALIRLKNRIFIFALIAALLVSFTSCKKEEDTRLLEYEQRRAELTLEKQEYIDEQYRLREGAEDYAGKRSFMSFVFISLGSGLYDDVLPLFNDNELPLKGVMALSPDELPGLEGNITKEQYLEITELGWETAVYWEGPPVDKEELPIEKAVLSSAERLDAYLTAMQISLTALGIDMPQSLVFGCQITSDEYESVLLKHGIESVLRDDTVNHEIVTTDYPEGVWYSGVLGWRDLYRSTRIKNKVEAEGGYASFMVSFDNSKENFSTSFYPLESENVSTGTRLASFERMLLRYRESIKSGKIEVLGIAEARARMKNYYDSKEAYIVRSAARIKELDLMIEDVDRRLYELYREFYGEYNSEGGQ